MTCSKIYTNKKIIKCLVKMKIPFKKSEVLNLNLDSFKSILITFIEFFTGKNFEKINRPKLKPLEYFYFPELHEKSTVFINKFRLVQKILLASKINDFSIQDFLFFNSLRIKKIFSSVIYFAKYKEKFVFLLNNYNRILSKIEIVNSQFIVAFFFLKRKILFLQSYFFLKIFHKKKIKIMFEEFKYNSNFFSNLNFLDEEKIMVFFNKKKNFYYFIFKKKSQIYKIGFLKFDNYLPLKKILFKNTIFNQNFEKIKIFKKLIILFDNFFFFGVVFLKVYKTNFFFFFIYFFLSIKIKIKIYNVERFKFFFQKKHFIKNLAHYSQENFLKNLILTKKKKVRYKNSWMNIKSNFLFVSRKTILHKNFNIGIFLKIFPMILVKIIIEKYSILIIFFFSFFF
jgi:hypothetical protein